MPGSYLLKRFLCGLAFLLPAIGQANTATYIAGVEQATRQYLTDIIQPTLRNPANFEIITRYRRMDSERNPSEKNCPFIEAEIRLTHADAFALAKPDFYSALKDVSAAFVRRLNFEFERCKSVSLLYPRIFEGVPDEVPYSEPAIKQLKESLENYLVGAVAPAVEHPEEVVAGFVFYCRDGSKSFVCGPIKVRLRVAESDLNIVNDPLYRLGLEHFIHAIIVHHGRRLSYGKSIPQYPPIILVINSSTEL